MGWRVCGAGVWRGGVGADASWRVAIRVVDGLGRSRASQEVVRLQPVEGMVFDCQRVGPGVLGYVDWSGFGAGGGVWGSCCVLSTPRL